MTKILAIEGTDIRLEIKHCDGCPLLSTTRDGDPWGCSLLNPTEYDPKRIIPDCPLPEKVGE